LKELQDKVVKSVDNFQVLTENNLNEALTTQPLETFAPYEAKKKIEEVIIVYRTLEINSKILPLFKEE